MLEGVTLAGGASATGTFVTSDAGLLLSWDIVTSGYDGLIATPKPSTTSADPYRAA
jgi:hypothetical protein